MAICGVSMSFGLAKISPLVPPYSSPFTPNSSVFLGPKRNHQERWVGSSSSTPAAMSIKAGFGFSKGGAGLLEKPAFDQSQFDPVIQVEEGGDIGSLRSRKGVGHGDSYRVLLIDDIRHTEKLVAQVLTQAVPSVTPDDARKLFLESKDNGAAVVIVTVKEHAEFYSQMMIRGGLRSTIEPDSSGA